MIKEEEKDKIDPKEVEQDLGLKEGDIESCTKITDKRFYDKVPEARGYDGFAMLAYSKSRNEFIIVGRDNGKIVEAQTVTAGNGTMKTSVDLDNDGKEVKTEAIGAIMNIKGNNEYDFAVNLEPEAGLIEFQELRWDSVNRQYMSSDLETRGNINQKTTKEVDDMMKNTTNDNITDEVNKYNKVKENGKDGVEIDEIEDGNNEEDLDEEEQKNNKDKQQIEELKQTRIDKNEKLKKQEEEITSKFKTIEDLKAQIVKVDVKKTKLEEDISNIVNKMWEEYELTPNNVKDYKKPENVSLTQKKVNNLRSDIRELGSVNVDSIEEYKTLKERYDFMCEQRVDLENTMNKLRKIISDMTATMKEQFKKQFEMINKNFSEVFKELFGGGNASLRLEDEENILECGIDIKVQPPGKKLQNMMLLSGGEKAFTAIALLFAILKINPAPFCILDEIEAALDDANVYRYAEFLKQFSENIQFIVITHRKGTMEAADTVYGITMEENGISKLLSMKLA